MMRLDIKSYYASINHAILIGLLTKYYQDKNLLRLLTSIITVLIITKRGFTNPHTGISIRSPLATFFSAIYLMPLDDIFSSMDVCYIRYQDDIVILFKSKSQFRRGKQKLYKILNMLGLTLSRRKSYSGVIKDFHFLWAHITLRQ